MIAPQEGADARDVGLLFLDLFSGFDESFIEALENRISSIEEEMLANGSDFGKLATLQKELDEKNEDLLEKYERYEYLSELV